MKISPISLMIALMVFSGGVCLTDSPAQAQTKLAATSAFSRIIEVPSYLIQVEYAIPRSSYGGYGYGGGYGGYRYTIAWVTIAETTDLEEAEFIYDLYELAWQLGVLDEVAPDYGSNSFPIGVQMITEFHTVDLANMAMRR